MALPVHQHEDLITAEGEQLSRTALHEQLERLVASKHFRNSKRYPAFLRFVVEETLAGRTEGLKERTLGADVFARPNDYDTNADPIVRVTAGEIRKRLAQYYQESGHEQELRIELPLGAYVPHFYGPGRVVHHPEESAAHAPEPAAALPAIVPASVSAPVPAAAPEVPPLAPEPQHAEKAGAGGRRLLLAFFAMLLVALAAGGTWMLLLRSRPEAQMNPLWQPLLSLPKPALMVIGVHSFDKQGNEEEVGSHAAANESVPQDMLTSMVRSDMVPVSDIVSYSRLTDYLTRHNHGYSTLGASDATLEQIRNGPLVLIGGLDNLWTIRLTGHLRFRFQKHGDVESEIVDSQHPETVWRFDNLQRASGDTRDYAIVASYFDSTIDQPVLIVAGIGKAGTLVASEFVVGDPTLQGAARQLGLSRGKNVELILSTEILDGKAGPPRVVASTTW